MTTLYPQARSLGITWRDFNGAGRYFWTPGHGWSLASTGPLIDDYALNLNADVTLAQAERTLRQLGHTIGEWDD